MERRWWIWAGNLPHYLLCPVHTIAKWKPWKLPFSCFFLLLKETWQLVTIVNKCTRSKDSDCALGIFWIEGRLVLTCFPSRTRTVLLPLVGDLSRHLRMEKRLTWFLLPVPKSQYLALTLHFLSLVLSDCHLIVWQVKFTIVCLHWKLRIWQPGFSRELSL